MKSATGSESTPTRRIWTTVGPPHVATSGRARPMSDTKWPKRPTALTASTVLRPSWAITGLHYSCQSQDAKSQAVFSKKWPVGSPLTTFACEQLVTWRLGTVLTTALFSLRHWQALSRHRHPAAASARDPAAAAPARA